MEGCAFSARILDTPDGKWATLVPLYYLTCVCVIFIPFKRFGMYIHIIHTCVSLLVILVLYNMYT